MPRYVALRDLWISHENRKVSEGEEFEATFPEVNGKPMALGESLRLVEPEKRGKRQDGSPA